MEPAKPPKLASTDEIARGKVMKRLLPLLFILFFVNYIDRVNVGFAARTMNADLGMSTTAYGLGVAIFFVGYVIFEVPSNYAMHRFGARIWLARIAITWGIVACLHAFIVGPTSFGVIRLLLGIAEAGFAPGVLFYLTRWFPVRDRTKAYAAYLISMPLSTAIGGPISAFLITYGDGLFGIDGWRFMYFIEGLPAIALGFVVLAVLPNGPQDAKWLTVEEKDAIEASVTDDSSVTETRETSFRSSLTNKKTLMLCVMFFCIVYPMYSLGYFLPLVISGLKGQLAGLTDIQISMITFVPYLLAAIGMWMWGRHSQRVNERVWHFSVPAIIAALSIIVSAFAASSPILLLISVCVCAASIFASFPVFWSFPGTFLTAAAAAGGMALINSAGNVGGFASGYLTGWLRDVTGSYQAPFILMGMCQILAACLATTFLRQQNKAVAPPTRTTT